MACTDGCTKMQSSCQSKWVLNSKWFHFQLSKFSLILQDTERTYSLVPKHHSSSLQYNRTNSLIRPKCRACWKTGNIQDVVREGENLPCRLGGLVLLLQSQCLGAKDYLVRKDSYTALLDRHQLERDEVINPVEGNTQMGQCRIGMQRSKELMNAVRLFWWQWDCRNEWIRLHQVQENLVLIREAEHVLCSFHPSQDHPSPSSVSSQKPNLRGLLTSITGKNNWIQYKHEAEPCYGRKPPATFRDHNICSICFWSS